MANQLALATQQTLPAGWYPVPPGNNAPVTNIIDLNAVREYEREHLIRYSVTLSGNYTQHVRGQNVGEVLNLQAPLSPATYQAQQFWGYRGPVRGYVLNIGSTGYSMSICPGADVFHWLLVIFSGVATELAAAAYPAPLAADPDIVVEFTGTAWM